MGGAFNAADRINGGADFDLLSLDGDYSAGITFNATTLRNMEAIALNPGHDYKLTTVDATVAAGETLFVNSATSTGPGINGRLGVGDTVYFDGSAETNGRFSLTGGPSGDTLIGGAQGDAFYSGGGGADTMRGRGGDDEFFFGGDLNSNDKVDGGSGQDIMFINGDYSAGLTLIGPPPEHRSHICSKATSATTRSPPRTASSAPGGRRHRDGSHLDRRAALRWLGRDQRQVPARGWVQRRPHHGRRRAET